MSIDILFNSYEADFFVLRTPVLPFKILTDLLELSNRHDRAFEQRLKELFSDKLIQEGIYIASPDLHGELMKYLSNENPPSKDQKRIQISLLRYLTRMTSRCTPFGLFAGYNLGSINDLTTKLRIGSSSNIVKRARLDMDYLSQLVNKITRHYKPDQFSYCANSTIYRVGDKLRYIEVIYLSGQKSYRITHVNYNDVLPEVIQYARPDRSFIELVCFLHELGLPAGQAASYVQQLIDAQILVNSLQVNVTGEEYMHALTKELNAVDSLKSEGTTLFKAIEKLENVKCQSEVGRYKDIKRLLEAITPDIEESKLFQLDMLKSVVSCTLNKSLLKEIKEACAVTTYLSAWQPGKDRLSAFKKAFEGRYETATVKLTDVLDPEIGIDYQTVKIGDNAENLSQEYLASNQAAFFKFLKYKEALKNSSRSISILKAEVEKFKKPVYVPASLSAMIRLYSNAVEAPQIEFRYASGPSAARLLGRFCHSSEELTSKVKTLLQAEEGHEAHAIFAELAHIPQDRMGNVIARPHLRSKEIVFLSKSTLNVNDQIHLDDLYLRLDRGKLILISKRLNKEIIPRLTSAHNFGNNNLQIYHFLGDLQFQDMIPGISWTWDFLSMQEFLPRVYYEKVIISPALWNLTATHLEFIKEKDIRAQRHGLEALKQRLKIPDFVLLVEGDNELLLDLDKPFSLEVLRKSFVKGNILTLKESLFTETNLIVSDEKENAYFNEIIIPLTKKLESKRSDQPVYHFNKKITRDFEPGSEWSYFKIFTGVSTADVLIKNVIFPFAEKLLKKGSIDKWFFIRYNDPGFHLRIRFHRTRADSAPDLTKEFYKLLKPYFESNEINDFSMHTYKREIERYGLKTMALSETFFHMDSMFVCRLLNLFKGLSPNQFFIMSLVAVDLIVTDFKLTFEQKCSFYSANRLAFSKEFRLNSSKTLKEKIQNEYRVNREFVKRAFEQEAEQDVLYLKPLRKLYFDMAKDLTPIISAITTITSRKGNLPTPVLLSSYVHMFINRLYSSNNRFHEFMVYEYLDRYHLGIAAKKR
jgi:thiopeptide-type bacteriocin biosynthesis protein